RRGAPRGPSAGRQQGDRAVGALRRAVDQLLARHHLPRLAGVHAAQRRAGARDHLHGRRVPDPARTGRRRARLRDRAAPGPRPGAAGGPPDPPAAAADPPHPRALAQRRGAPAGHQGDGRRPRTGQQRRGERLGVRLRTLSGQERRSRADKLGGTMAETTVVHLLRHGEVHNPGGILYGRLPGYHLSETGELMAKTVAKAVSGRDIATIYSSPLERARETAAPVAAVHGLEVIIDDRLLEA